MRWYFFVFGCINLLALGIAFALSLSVVVEYFSYFTVLSNILITAVFLSIGFLGPKRAGKEKVIQALYGPAVLYMGITGIVYWTILHGGKQLTTDVEWITLVLHGLMPIMVTIAWLFFKPFFKYSWQHVAYWLLFPLLFVGYTLLRGPSAHWYPYPFLNPLLVGYTGVMVWTGGILAGGFVLGFLLIQLSASFHRT